MSTDGFYQLRPKNYKTKLLLSKNHEKEIVFRHGHIAITDYTLGDNFEFEKSLSTFDEIRHKYNLIGGYYVESLKEFRVNRGYNLGMLSGFFPNHKARVENDAYPADKVDIKLLTPPRDDFQRVALTFMCSQGDYKSNSKFTQQIIDADTGDGKAQPDDTPVLTENGWVRLDSLKVGDQVYNHRHELVKVSAIYPQNGPQTTYTIHLSDGKHTRCNAEHLWNVMIYGQVFTMSLSEILEYIQLHRIPPYLIRIPVWNTAVDYVIWKKIDRIVEEPEKTTQRCILIDDPDHLYITEDYIITHNTYCGVAVSCFMQARAVVIAPLGKLFDQWKRSYLEFTNGKEKDVLVVRGSKMCQKIIEGKYKHVKFFIFSTDTIGAFHSQYGDLETIELFRATNAYVKIIDEIHLDMKNVSMIEALSNFHMNFYMSASPGRSDRKENWIFNTCFKNIPRFGSKFKVQEEKHVNVIVKRYRFVPTPDQQKRMTHPRTKWLNSKSYERELITSPEPQVENFCTECRSMLRWSKGLLKKGNKILILCATVAGTEFMKDLAEELFPGECAQYYGGMSKKDQAEALEKTVICATEASMGTGADIPNVQHTYNIITYTTWIATKQNGGRGRRLKDGTATFYCEMVNMSFIKTLRQYEKRKPELVKRSKTGKIMLID